MGLNWFSIIVATVAQFVVGAIWYTALFGKLWGKMHGFDKLPKETQKKMMSMMGPVYGVQFLVTLFISIAMAMLLAANKDWSSSTLAALLWFGFSLPQVTSSVLFGGTDPKWIVTKIAVQAGSAFVCLQVAAAVIQAMS